jgi:hypothetical protein
MVVGYYIQRHVSPYDRLQLSRGTARGNAVLGQEEEEQSGGAAELSRIELNTALSTDSVKVFYVTDVVTDRNHRRQGISRP